jgi:hypothetical protein
MPLVVRPTQGWVCPGWGEYPPHQVKEGRPTSSGPVVARRRPTCNASRGEGSSIGHGATSGTQVNLNRVMYGFGIRPVGPEIRPQERNRTRNATQTELWSLRRSCELAGRSGRLGWAS